MVGNDLNQYVARFRSLYLRLQSLGAPMSEGDAVHKFAWGLSPKLRSSCPLEDHASLTAAIAKVTRKHHSRELFNMFPSERQGSGRRRDAALYAVGAEAEDDGWEPPYDEEEYDDYEEEAALMAMSGGRGRGNRGGRGNGRGRGRSGYRGGARGGRGGGRGRGRYGPKKPLTEEQRKRFAAGLCLHCGSADHWASDCPMKPPATENA